jgi:hypothetical protein
MYAERGVSFGFAKLRRDCQVSVVITMIFFPEIESICVSLDNDLEMRHFLKTKKTGHMDEMINHFLEIIRFVQFSRQ